MCVQACYLVATVVRVPRTNRQCAIELFGGDDGRELVRHGYPTECHANCGPCSRPRGPAVRWSNRKDELLNAPVKKHS